MAAAKKLVLVDGTALIFRAYFAIPANFATTKGLHTNAIYGFATMFRKLFAGRKPELGAVVFDSGGKTFHEEKYPQYKAQRPPLPDDLFEQFAWIDRVVEAHRFPRVRVDGYEADDVIGTLAVAGAAAGHEVLIVSGDKDFAQLIGERIRMFDPLRDVTYDSELVRKKWGVKPPQMIDLLALMGDSVDNIPGVAGIGAKGATTLLETYGSLTGIYEKLGELKGKQKTALETGRDAAMLSRELATIDIAAKLPVTLADLALVPPEPAALNTLYKELEFYSLLSDDERSGVEHGTGAGEYTVLADTAAAIAAIDAEFAAGVPVAVVPLHDGPLVRGRLAGIALCTKPDRAIYLPLEGEGAKPGGAAFDRLRAHLGDAAKPKLTHDVKALWLLLKRRGIELRGVTGDAMLASYTAEPTKLIPHRLDQIAREYLQRTLKPLKDLTGSGQKEKPIAAAPVEDAGEIACSYADALVSSWPKIVLRLEAISLFEHFRDHELPLAFVLGKMELDGIKVDPVELAAAGKEFATLRAAEEKTVHELGGRVFNIGSTKQLGAVLFDELKLPILKRTKTGYSTDSEVLEKLALKHPMAKHVLEFRKFEKLINTYTDVLRDAISPETGRVHATLQQTAGASGRLIATDPDLQRTPVKTPEGKRIRMAFVAEPGHRLIAADWSQIELRVLAHISGDPLLVDSFQRGIDVHRRTASQIFHVEPAAVTRDQRDAGKTVNFATIYGQGATALGQILGIPRTEAAGYIDEYFRAYAGVRTWLDETMVDAHEKGYVTTLLGRRRWIPELFSKNQMDAAIGERIAANTPIQGSGADLCKLAMLEIARRLEREKLRTKMLVQIHDELVFEAPESEVERACALVKDVMEGCYPLKVPLVAEVGHGATWAGAKG